MAADCEADGARLRKGMVEQGEMGGSEDCALAERVA